MLGTYRTNCFYLQAGVENQVAELAERKKINGMEFVVPRKQETNENFIGARSYRRNHHEKSQHAIGRIRAAVAIAFPSFDHATAGAISRQVAKRARFVRCSEDSPNDNLSFSRPGISSTNHKRRTSVKFSRYVRRQCADLIRGKLSVTDATVEKMQNAFRLVPVCNGLDLSIISGRAAFEFYRDNDVSWSTGTSCMSGDDADKVEHYFRANSATIRLVVGHKNGSPAIKAKLFANKDGSHFLDRVYYLTGDFESEPQSREFVAAWIVSQGLTISPDYNFRANHEIGNPIPYCDRADRFDRVDDCMVRFHPSGEFCAGNVNGEDESAADDDRSTCCDCGERIDDDDCQSHDGESYCQSCFDSRFTYCDETDCSELQDDVTIDDVDDRSILSSSAVQLLDGRWTHDDNANKLDTEFYSRNRYGLNDETVKTHNDEWILSEDSHEWTDGTVHHVDEVEPEPEDEDDEDTDEVETGKVGDDNV